MWCRNCNIETNEEKCIICGRKTIEEIQIEMYWCNNCRTPIIQDSTYIDKESCPHCGNEIKYMSKDLRPVFPEERLLLEILLKKEPNIYVKSSVWVTNNRYFIDGKLITLPSKLFRTSDVEEVTKKMLKYKEENDYKYFEQHIESFIKANEDRLYYLIDEASRFVKYSSKKYEEESVVISFSGGKDSTVTADVVIKALGNPSLVHIFGDTTLEFPLTYEYTERYRNDHPQAIFQIARNNDQVFYDVCKDIGPPARMMRWCCSMFKTGPITRVIDSLYRNAQILTFYGIRKAESASRSKYKRIEDDSESVKIQQQTVASPIFFWKDIDVWLYIFNEKIDFNDAYRLGYDRVGCWCCPNNNHRAQFLSKIYMPEQSVEWRTFLIDFANKIGKPDAEEYIDSGNWKARQGGNGVPAASDVKLKFTNCTSEDNSKIYSLVKQFDDELIGMFTPFGKIAPELGQKLLNEILILDIKTNVPILSIQPFSQDGYEYAVKVKTMNVEEHEKLQRMAGYQIRKFNACRKCLKCESICQAGAIIIDSDNYYINPEKCVHCKKCVSAKHIAGGCMMDKYLRTK